MREEVQMNDFYCEYLDAYVDRSGTNCIKWDCCEDRFGSSDVIPMWVADMDFRTVPAISEALVTRAQHAIYGYTDNTDAEKQAEIGWLKRRYNLDAQKDWIMYSPGVVDSIFFSVRCLTEKGDKVLIQPPVYGPFFRAIKLFEREMVENHLILTENGWQMDFETLEKQFAEGVKLMIFCNPHNPIGRVWTRDEVQRLVNLANKYNVIIVSDEIHSDFNFGRIPHTRILSLENSDNCVMLTSATKSFNLAGLRQSSILVKNEELREKIREEIKRCHAGTPNIFGGIAQTTAYSCGDEWMDAVVEYIRENRDFVVDYFAKNIPEIKVYPQDGTYLMWLDCRNVGAEHEEFCRLLQEKAKVGLNDGTEYGETGRGYFRLNLATQRAKVEKTAKAIEELVRSINQ